MRGERRRGFGEHSRARWGPLKGARWGPVVRASGSRAIQRGDLRGPMRGDLASERTDRGEMARGESESGEAEIGVDVLRLVTGGDSKPPPMMSALRNASTLAVRGEREERGLLGVGVLSFRF